MLAGINPRLLVQLIASLPMERLAGFVLVGPAPIARLSRMSGCMAWLPDLLGGSGRAAWHAIQAVAGSRPIVAIGADDAGNDWIDRLHEIAPIVSCGHGSGNARALLRDKWQFHQLCRELGVPMPQTRWLPDKAALADADLRSQLGVPLVIKPVNGEASIGLALLDEGETALAALLADPAYTHAPLLAQRYIPGDDVGLSILARDGEVLHWCAQVWRAGALTFLEDEEFLGHVRTIVARTRFSGLAHFDSQRGAAGLYLLECNTRPWASLGQATWAGLNFVDAAIAVAMGEEACQPRTVVGTMAPRLADWWRASIWRPWRLTRLAAGQRRLAMTLLRNYLSLARGRTTLWRAARARRAIGRFRQSKAS